MRLEKGFTFYIIIKYISGYITFIIVAIRLRFWPSPFGTRQIGSQRM